ncbi:MAG: QcrA and Rieske domain-containing protein [Gemmatirosa sp.]
MRRDRDVRFHPDDRVRPPSHPRDGAPVVRHDVCEMSLMSRRDLLRAGVGVLACPLLAACAGAAPTESSVAPRHPDDAVTVTGDIVHVEIARVPAFARATADEVAVVFLGAQVIVVRRGLADFRALSAVCPHAGCGVSVVRAPRLVCPCHGSEFDFAGHRLEGPAPTGLPVLPSSFDAATQRVRIQRRSV